MNSGESVDFSEIRGALGSIGISSMIVIGGTVLSQAMGFGTRIVMTNFLPVDGYGELVLGITVLNFLGIVSIIGLGPAMSRYLPRAENMQEQKNIAAAIYQIGITLSIFWSIVGFFGADIIAGSVFNQPNMGRVIRVFSLSLPFFVLFKLSLKGIQGHKETFPNIITKNLILPTFRLGAVGVCALAGYGVFGIAIGFNTGYVVAGAVGFALFLRAGSYQIRSLIQPVEINQYRELLAFSLPLAITASLGIITKQSDVFLLGILGTTNQVGIYDIIFLVSQFLLFFSPAIGYLFQPIISELDADNEYDQMNQLYTIVTRWIVVLTFPIFVLVVLFPGPVLATFFGEAYRSGGPALAILAVAFFSTRLVGLSGSFLTATGDTNTLMYISTATSVLNIGLNVALIPFYGIVGAAVATAGARILNNALQSMYIYRDTKIHPFKRELIVPTGLICFSIAGTKMFLLKGTIINFPFGFTISAIFGILYIVLIFGTKSVYKIELELLDSLLNLFGIQFKLSQRLEVFARR